MAAAEPTKPDDTLTPLLHPTSVAVIGASDNPARIGGRPIRYMRDAGYGGTIYPVNPNRETVQGMPAFPHITEVPGPVDTAIIAVPAPTVVETAEACAAAGVKAAVIFSAGFAEMSADGGRRQDALTAIARTTGMRIVGPNCLGVYNSATGFFATSSPPPSRRAPRRPGESGWSARAAPMAATYRCSRRCGVSASDSG